MAARIIKKGEETSGGAATFHTPVQETPAAGPSARVRPREKNGGGGKAGNRDDETWHDAREDWWEEVAYEEAKTGGREDKAREGSSTPSIETPAVGASADVRPRVADGGGEGTKATTDEGAERSIQEVTFNEGGFCRGGSGSLNLTWLS